MLFTNNVFASVSPNIKFLFKETSTRSSEYPVLIFDTKSSLKLSPIANSLTNVSEVNIDVNVPGPLL